MLEGSFVTTRIGTPVSTPRPVPQAPATYSAPAAAVKPAVDDSYGYGPLGQERNPAAKAKLIETMKAVQKSPGFSKLDAASQKAVLDGLVANAPVTAAKLQTLNAALGSGELAALSPANRKVFLEALSKGGFNGTFAASLTKLASNASFRALKPDEQTAVLSQAKNYPNTASVGNLEKLVGKKWFGAESLEDKQRSLKTIAFMSAPGPGDRAILDNTLNKIIGPDAKFELSWKPLTQGRLGNASDDGKTLELNSNWVNAGDGKEVYDYLAKSIVPHEVNHLLSEYQPGSSAKFMEAEYRGWYVGFQALHGRPPSRADAANYFTTSYLKGPNTQIYSGYALGVTADKNEAPAFFEMMSKATGIKIEQNNWVDGLPAYAKNNPKLKNEPAPPPSGNVTNA